MLNFQNIPFPFTSGEDRDPNLLQNQQKLAVMENFVFDGSNTPSLAPNTGAVSNLTQFGPPSSTGFVLNSFSKGNQVIVTSQKNASAYYAEMWDITQNLRVESYVGNDYYLNFNYKEEEIGTPTTGINGRTATEESVAVATGGGYKATAYVKHDGAGLWVLVMEVRKGDYLVYRNEEQALIATTSKGFTSGGTTYAYSVYVEPKVAYYNGEFMFAWVKEGSGNWNIYTLTYDTATGIGTANGKIRVSKYDGPPRIDLVAGFSDTNRFGLVDLEPLISTSIGHFWHAYVWGNGGVWTEVSGASRAAYPLSNASLCADGTNFYMAWMENNAGGKQVVELSFNSGGASAVSVRISGAFQSQITGGHVSISRGNGKTVIFADDVSANPLYPSAGEYLQEPGLYQSNTPTRPLRQPISRIVYYDSVVGVYALFNTNNMLHWPFSPVAAPRGHNNCMLYGRAVYVNGMILVPTIVPSGYDPTIVVYAYVATGFTPLPVGVIAPRNAGNFPAQSSIVDDGATTVYYSAHPLFDTAIEAETATDPFKAHFSHTKWADSATYSAWTPATACISTLFNGPMQGIEVANRLFLAGSCPRIYDGTRHFMANFVHAPFIRFKQTTGGALADGTYQFCATFRFTDANGNVYESPPSAPQTITIGSGGGTAAIDVINADFASPTTDMFCELVVYRTDTNGTVFRTTNYDLPNKKWGTDSATTWASNTLLYTTGDIHENDPIPPCNTVAIHDERIFVSDHKNTYFTDQIVSGYEFSTSSIFKLDVGADALMSMDEKLITFGTNIGVIYGQGPDELGEGSSLKTDILHRSSVIAPFCRNSVVGTNDGIWFQSTEGLRLLGRNLAIVASQNGALGAEMDDLILGKRVVKAISQQNKDRVWFFYHDYTNNSTAVKTIVLNENKQFTTWKVADGLTGTDRTLVTVYPQNELSTSTKLGTVGIGYVCTNGSDYFASTLSTNPDQATIETNWLSFDDIEGFQRLTRMIFLGKATASSSTTMTLTTYLNYSGTATSTATIVLAADSSGIIHYEYQLPVQKFTSIKFKMVFTPVSPATSLPAYFAPQGLKLKVGKKNGNNKLATTSRG